MSQMAIEGLLWYVLFSHGLHAVEFNENETEPGGQSTHSFWADKS